LERDTIGKILKGDIMRESTTDRWILKEGERECQRVAINLLKEGVSFDFIARVTGLSIEEIQQIQANREQN
jgi:predicted HTH domain antitoxin